MYFPVLLAETQQALTRHLQAWAYQASILKPKQKNKRVLRTPKPLLPLKPQSHNETLKKQRSLRQPLRILHTGLWNRASLASQFRLRLFELIGVLYGCCALKDCRCEKRC